jgi:type II secretory pathway component PulC
MKEFDLKKYLAENKLVKEELGKYQEYSSDEEYEKIQAIIKAIKDLGDTLSKNGKIDLASALEPIAKTLKYRGGYYP